VVGRPRRTRVARVRRRHLPAGTPRGDRKRDVRRVRGRRRPHSHCALHAELLPPRVRCRAAAGAGVRGSRPAAPRFAPDSCRTSHRMPFTRSSCEAEPRCRMRRVLRRPSRIAARACSRHFSGGTYGDTASGDHPGPRSQPS
jgi:hypothetical protein